MRRSTVGPRTPLPTRALQARMPSGTPAGRPARTQPQAPPWTQRLPGLGTRPATRPSRAFRMAVKERCWRAGRAQTPWRARTMKRPTMLQVRAHPWRGPQATRVARRLRRHRRADARATWARAAVRRGEGCRLRPPWLSCSRGDVAAPPSLAEGGGRSVVGRGVRVVLAAGQT